MRNLSLSEIKIISAAGVIKFPEGITISDEGISKNCAQEFPKLYALFYNASISFDQFIGRAEKECASEEVAKIMNRVSQKLR